MELTGAWIIPVGGKEPLEFKWGGDYLPSGVTIISATKAVSPATGLTVDDPVVNGDATGVIFWATAVTAGDYKILIVATRSDGGKNIALGYVYVAPASDRTSLAANALVTFADFMGYVPSETPINKNLAETIINAVSTEFDRVCGRTLKQATYTNLYLDGNGERTLNLPNWPADSATFGTVTENGTLLVNGLTGDYVLYTSDDDAYLRKVGATWPELGESCAAWFAGPKTVLISTVKLGYATVPGDIVLVCLKQCALEYQRAKQRTWGETSRSVGEGSVSLVEPGLLPDVEAVLKRYRRAGL